MFNNRGGSCHCCLGCGSAWNRGAKWNRFFSNRRLNILKVKQSKEVVAERQWLDSLSPTTFQARCPLLSSVHWPWTSAERLPQASSHLLFSITHVLPFSGSALLKPLAPTYFVTITEFSLSYFKMWQQNHRLEACVCFSGTEVGWGVLEQVYSLGAPGLAKWSEENMHRMCVACSELLFNPRVD